MTPRMRLRLREGPGTSEDHSRENNENSLQACGWRRGTLAHMSGGDGTWSGGPH